MTLAECCICVAFLSVPLRDIGIDFSFIPVSSADQMHADISSLCKSDARFSKCFMHCFYYLCNCNYMSLAIIGKC